MNKATTVEILQCWCLANDCEWGNACLLDAAAWNARRRARQMRGEDLPAADCVVRLAGSGLYEIVNEMEPADGRYRLFLTYLREHGLGVQRLSKDYARLYRLRAKTPN